MADTTPAEAKTITIRCPAWILDDLRARATKQGVSVTEWIRRAVVLQRFIEDHDTAEWDIR